VCPFHDRHVPFYLTLSVLLSVRVCEPRFGASGPPELWGRDMGENQVRSYSKFTMLRN